MKYYIAMNEQSTVTCSNVWISKQCRGNVEQKKPNTKRAYIVWTYLIEVQKQEKNSGNSCDWKWSRVSFKMFVMFSLLIWELVTRMCLVCENMWHVQFFGMYSIHQQKFKKNT